MADRCSIGGFTRCGISYQVCRGGASTATEKRLCGICRCGNWYSLEGQVMCDLYFGYGTDGDCVISSNTTLPARTYNFCNLTICPGVKVDFSGGKAVPIIKAQGYVCNLGTIDLRSCEDICGCNCTYMLAGSIGNKASKCKLVRTPSGGKGADCYAGDGGGWGQNGKQGCYNNPYWTSSTCYPCKAGTSCCCNGGGGSGGPQCGSYYCGGCNATTTNGGDGGCAGGGGGYGCCCGGNGGNGWTNNSSSGANTYGGGGGGNGCYYGGNGGNGGCSGTGGKGGDAIYCNGGNGGSSATGGTGGDGGFSIWGTGGNGGNGGSNAYTCGGKGGDTMYGTGGNGGKLKNGGNATGGQYGLLIIAPCIYNTCIIGCGGTGGNGGLSYSTCNNYCKGGDGGYGGPGADVKFIYECSLTQGTICNCGGCGGCAGYYCCGSSKICCGANGANGANGTVSCCQVSFT